MADQDENIIEELIKEQIEKQENKGNSSSRANFAELGYTGLNRYGGHINEEFLSDLQGQKGIEIYKEMSNNDPVISAFLFAIRQLVRQVDWRIEQQKDTAEHREASEFLRQALFEDLDMEWDEFLGEVLTFLNYGFSLMEIVYKKRNGEDSKFDDGRIGWRSFEPRGQETVEEWEFGEHGKVEGVYQLGAPEYERVYLPKEKYLHFRTVSEQSNPRGKSILRATYRPYHLKKNLEEVEAIGMEKNLVGVPKLTPPDGLDIWDDSDPEMINLRNNAENLVKNLRRDEQEGVVLPNGWELELIGQSGQQPSDVTDTIIKRYDQRLAMSTLADFLVLSQNEQGSYAMNVSKQQLFQQALDGWVNGIADTLNEQGVKRLFELNDFDIEEYPKVKPSSIQSVSLETLGQFISNVAGAGAPLFPDDELENELKRRANLPVNQGESNEQ